MCVTDSLWSARKGLLAGIAFTVSIGLAGACAADDREREDDDDRGFFCLSVLHNNDAESQIIAAGSRDLEDFGGAAEFVTVVQQEKRDARRNGCRSLAGVGAYDDEDDDEGLDRGVVIVSSGDNFLAGPEFTASLETRNPPLRPYYDSTVVSRIGYDALALGNHEFDFGTDVLREFIVGVRRQIPFLSANLDFSEEPGLQALVERGRIAKSIVVRKNGRRVGIIGATTEQLPLISQPGDTIINAVQPAVQAEIDALRAKGVEIIVLISHLQSVNDDLDLIGELSGLDIAIAGGGDEVLANPLDPLVPGDERDVFGPYPLIGTGADGVDVPVVTTAGNYKYVGRLDCLFDRHGRVVDCDGGPVRVAQIPESGPAPADAVRPNRLIERRVTEPVAVFLDDLAADVIGSTEVGLNGVRSNVRTIETNLGDLIADALLQRVTILADEANEPLPDVALQNGGGIRNDDIRGPGDLTRLDTFDILPFSNFLSIVPDIPRSQFKQILERAVSAVENVQGRFAQVGGFSFSWDPAGIAQELDSDGNIDVSGTRVIDVTLDDGTEIVTGGAVQPGPDLNIATIDFLARGGDGYPFAGAPFTILDETYQQALETFIIEDLSRLVEAADYPEGGEGRIERK